MSEVAVPDVGLLIDDLAIAYQKSFGASRIGARERLNAAHLVETLNRFDAEPDRIRGVLRAALAKTKAEADLFDRVYPDAGRGEAPSPDPAPSPRPEPPAPEPEPGPGKSRKRLFLWLGVGAAVVAAAIFMGWLSTRPADTTDNPANNADPGRVVTGNENADPDAPADPISAGAMQSNTTTVTADDTATAAYAEEVSAILDRASEFGYRPSPRELASSLANSFDLTEADLTREIAHATGQAPDLPLDLFDFETLGAVRAAIHGPVAQGVNLAVVPAAIIERARRQTEYITFEDGRLNLHWRDGDTWQEQTLEGEAASVGPATIMVSPDASHALTITPEASTLWNLVDLKLVTEVVGPPGSNGAAPPNGAFIPGTNDAIVYGAGSTHYLTADGPRSPEQGKQIIAFAASASGSGYLTLDSDGMAEVWDAATRTRRGASMFTAGDVDSIVLSDNLEWWLAGRGANAELGRVSSLIESFSPRTLPVSLEFGAAYFVANDTRILVNHLGGVELYDVDTGELVSSFEAFTEGKSSASAFPSNDRSTVFVEATPAAGPFTHLAAMDARNGALLADPLVGIRTSADTIAQAPGLIASWQTGSDGALQGLTYIPRTKSGFAPVSNNLPLPVATAYLNIPSIAEAATRAAAFAETRKPKPLPDWPMWLAVAIPLLIAAVFLAHPASWRRAYLSRRKIESDTLIRKLTANVTTFEPLAGERRAVGRLDQRLRQPSHRLDLRETVVATARAGGMFTPVADTDAGTPEYVALIERRRLTDADAARMVAFFNRLRAAGLSLTLYTYSGTPEALTPLRGGHAIPIETLRQRHAGAFLLITGDSARFHNRKTGGVATWTSRLGPVRRPGQGRSFAPTWSGGAFLSREPMPRLGPAERAIERDLGLIVRHTDASDLTAIGEYFHGRSATLAPHDEEGRKPVPAYFATNPERLVEEEPPGVIERQDLAPQLEAWLGAEGLRWVRALAYYPIVQWDLALYLASILMPHMPAEARAAMEAKVARLPWLEHGFMPDWVRQTLVEGADPKEEKRIVREIVAVMAEAREGADGNISFQLMDPASGAASEHTGDAIFIDAVARAKARPWDLPPPSQWLRRAPEALQMPWARMRIAIAAVVLAIAAAIFTPHSGNMAPLAQWTPVLLFGLLAMAMAVGPMLLSRYADRGRG